MNETAISRGQTYRKANSAVSAAGRSRLAPRWLIVLLAVAALGVAPGTMWAQSTAEEYHVKAAFIFHFAQLVEWPADAPNDGGNSLLVCTLGDDPFHGELENAIAGKAIGTRIVRIRHATSMQNAHGCNVLFFGNSESKRIRLLTASLRNAPVLTIGEADDFLVSGGMIRFCLDGNKVRFEISREAAALAKLKVSSQLLLLARNRNGGK